MSFYERDAEGKLVPMTEVPEGAIQAIERYDEDAIVQRMTTGIASRAFIYSYPIKTATGVKEIVGISTDGADELSLMLGNLEVLPDIRVDKDSDPDYIYVMVRAKDLIRNVTLLGTGRTCKFQLDKGNKPDHDRINEWAFVSSVSKAQRNAILRLVSEEAILRIIEAWSKSGKGRQVGPPKLQVIEEAPPRVAQPAPAATATPTTPTAEQVTEQQEKLKKLRLQVHNRFQTDLDIKEPQRKEMLQKRFGVDSLTQLSEQDLRACLAWVEDMVQQRTVTPPATPPPGDKVKELGFDSTDEQNKLRSRLYTVLTSPNELNLKDDEAKKFITDRGFTSTSNINKQSLLGLVQEASELAKTKKLPSEF